MRARALGPLAILAGLLLLAPAPARGGAQFVIVNADAAGEGFNDPAPATPVGGNTGTTVGQQRLIAFEEAAAIWGELLDTPVEIRVRATFDPLPCSADEGALGGAAPDAVVSDSPNAPLAGTWYPAALASRLAAEDVDPSSDDIVARFNSDIGQADCLEGSGWYYGLDGAHGDSFDLVTVLLHELGHGLGFLTLVDESIGEEFMNQPDVFESMILDTQTNKLWTEMTPAERAASAVNGGHVVFDGPAVGAAAPDFLGPFVGVHIDAPAAIAGDLEFVTASFGPAVGSDALSGELVQAADAADASGPATTDGCSAFSNASQIAGRMALVDRGDCDFVVKAANAQAAGAIAMVVANNVASQMPGMGGTAPEITIPSIGVNQAEGAALKASLDVGVVLSIGTNPRRLAGAGALNRPRLYAPNPTQPGSSISHWDTGATPNLLMEPDLNDDLPHEVDLTLPLLRDIGWLSDTVPGTQHRETPDGAEADAERSPQTVDRP